MIYSGSGARGVLRIGDNETALVDNNDESLGKGTVQSGGGEDNEVDSVR